MIQLIRICLAFSIFLAYSCSPAYYGPSTMYLPTLEEKGDLQVSANGSRSRSDNVTVLDSEGFDINVAYSPKDKVTLTGGYTQFKNVNVTANDGIESNLATNNLKMGNLGLGYYTPLNDLFKWESYIDAHLGHFDGDRTLSNVEARTSKIGIKTGLAYESKYVSVLMGLGLYNLRYNNIQGEALQDVTYLNDHSSSLLREFSLTFRVGTEKIQGQWQFGRSSNMTHPDFLQTNSYSSIGILLNLNLLEEKNLPSN